jgi:hypothetical protein
MLGTRIGRRVDKRGADDNNEYLPLRAGVAQLVERVLAKHKVDGSKPFTRSKYYAGVYGNASAASESGGWCRHIDQARTWLGSGGRAQSSRRSLGTLRQQGQSQSGADHGGRSWFFPGCGLAQEGEIGMGQHRQGAVAMPVSPSMAETQLFDVRVSRAAPIRSEN